LKKAYPDLPWRENWKIIESPWNDIHKVRQFFDAYAKTVGFDPLVPDNWYQMSTKALKTAKVVSYIVYYSCVLQPTHLNNIGRTRNK